MAAGDVVVTAFRLQQSAPVSGIVVGEATYRASQRSIGYREIEPIEAKGKEEPVRAWEAVAVEGRGRQARRPARRPRVRAVLPQLTRIRQA
jgi:class 3 adenylate cyclase